MADVGPLPFAPVALEVSRAVLPRYRITPAVNIRSSPMSLASFDATRWNHSQCFAVMAATRTCVLKRALIGLQIPCLRMLNGSMQSPRLNPP
jgi:hypothetical protein